MTTEQGDQIIAWLAYIAERIDAVFAAAADDVHEGVCPHPEDKRVSVSSWGDANHWICSVCRFDNKAS